MQTTSMDDVSPRLINLFKSCLNTLRDNEGITGDKALKNLSYLLILKLLEPYIDNGIDFSGVDYQWSKHFTEKVLDHNRERLMALLRFSNLSQEKDDDIPRLMKYLWTIILSEHPATCKVFLKTKNFDIQHKSTFKQLVDKINSFDFSSIEHDILGNAYEEVIKDIMTGKVLGQFFTQPLVKNMMVRLIDPKLHPDGTMETCADPSMGTGGFLITYINYMQQKAKEQGVSIDWDFVLNGGLYGREIDADTYQLAVSNMLISTGHMFSSLERGDSIRRPITSQYDHVLANPPFGIKGLRYDDFSYVGKDQYIPIASDNAVCLFIQAIISMLKVNGTAAVVVPNGQELFNKNTVSFVRVREYLMKTCDLKEVILMPSDVFNYTSVKTCVLYFEKKAEGTDVITLNENKKNPYTFVDDLATESVRFYDWDPKDDVKTLLAEVDIGKIKNNSYSLNYMEYVEQTVNYNKHSNYVIMKTLGEVCEFQNGKSITKKELLDGPYPVIGGGQSPLGYHNQYNRNENTILCSSSGAYAGYVSKYDTCVWASDCFSIISKNDNVSNKFLYYYLKANQDDIYKLQTGSAQPHIYSKDISKLQIPIPSLEKQKDIVEYLDLIYEECVKTSNKRISQLKRLNEAYVKHNTLNVPTKPLGEVCKSIKTGKDIVQKDRKKGIYPFYGANGIIDHIDEYIFDGQYLLTARTGSIGSLHISQGKFWCTGDVHRIKFENATTLRYVYHYLHTIDFQKYRTGAAHPKLSGSNLKSIKIPIPSLEKQKEIVEYCENNEQQIKCLKDEIERNKTLAKEFLENCLSSNIEEEVVEGMADLVISDDSQQSDASSTNSDTIISSASVRELKEQCKSLGIRGYSRLRKSELIDLIASKAA